MRASFTCCLPLRWASLHFSSFLFDCISTANAWTCDQSANTSTAHARTPKRMECKFKFKDSTNSNEFVDFHIILFPFWFDITFFITLNADCIVPFCVVQCSATYSEIRTHAKLRINYCFINRSMGHANATNIFKTIIINNWRGARQPMTMCAGTRI